MAYTKTNWNDGAPPAISAANLNKIEAGIENNDTWNATQDGRISAVEGRADAQDAKIATLETDVKDILPTDTASGAIASFPDGSDLFDYLSCIVDIEPLQDLHGYDKPWVGGAGKNKIPLPSKRGYWAASNGVFSTDNTWVATEKIPVLPSTTYHISCSYVTRWCGIAAYQSDGTYIDSSLGDTSSSAGHVIDRTFTTQSNCGYIAVSIASVDGNSIQPSSITDLQVELGSAATSFAPWENICPITGWTGCEVDVSGVNVWDEDWEVGSISGQTGQSTSGSYVRSTNYISVKPNTIYYFNRPTGNKFWLYAYDENQTYMHDAFGTTTGYCTLDETTYLFTIPNGVYYIRFVVDNNYGTTYNNDISINHPSTDTTYHAYNGTTYSVSWQDDAGTVYGGTVDVVSGVLTAYPYYASYNGETLVGPWVSSMDEYVQGATPATGAQVVDLGGTPTTYQLDPVQVACLLGQNNVWADCGDTSVTYKADVQKWVEKKLGE